MAFLKEGWIQIGGENIPVFFKYDPTDKTYPFVIIFGAPEYYDLYDEWVSKGFVAADKLDVNSISKVYEYLRTTPEMFNIGVMQHLADYYWWRGKGNDPNSEKFRIEANHYDYIYKYLKNIKNAAERNTNRDVISS